jgi:hypothetical protein
MNLNRIRHVMAHHESIAGRLTFSVRSGKRGGQENGKAIYIVQPTNAGVAISYGVHESEAEALAEAEDYNRRSRAFLEAEFELMRQVILTEANGQEDDR